MTPPTRDPIEVPEIMTPAQVCDFLQLTPDKFDEVVERLPGFEIAGELRFRRTRIVEWIERREADRDREVLVSQLRAV